MKKVTFTPNSNKTPLENALIILVVNSEVDQDFEIVDGQIVEYDMTEEKDPIYWSVVESGESSVTLDC